MPGIMQQVIMRVTGDVPDLVIKYGEEVRQERKVLPKHRSYRYPYNLYDPVRNNKNQF